MRWLLSTLLVAFSSVLACAADEAKVEDAIKKGVAYLQAAKYEPAGSNYGIGTHCLAGLALMAADIKPGAGALAGLHGAVRIGAITEIRTYQISLAILFLDRYGDPADLGLIQILGARLLAGQTLGGGWSYVAFDAIDGAEEARLRASLAAPLSKGVLHPEAARIVAALARGFRSASSLGGGDDNSNTQFALMAVWVARRSGLPVEFAIHRLQSRFLRSQSVGDGGWGYGDVEGASSPSMTCAGLLGLAVAKATAESNVIAARPRAEKGKPEDEDPFLKPPAAGKDGDDADAPAAPPIDQSMVAQRDKSIERGLAGLGKLLDSAANVMVGGGTHGGLDDLYFYWSLERVAVAYGLDTIGGVDWYTWGCAGILAAQKDDGSWSSNYEVPAISTAFAILFLKKANLAADLSRQILGKIKDPGAGELRGGKGNLPTVIGKAGSKLPAKGDDPKGPKINALRNTAEADAMAEGLVNATDKDWPMRLKFLKDAKGPQHTIALVSAITALEGKKLYQTREALAERLTRMTSPTLKRMLADRDAEVRRAACLAVAMKDDRTIVLELIVCVTDPNDVVVRAAKASLKAMSDEDHGPPLGASDEDKRKAADAWRSWYARWNR